ncbi:hypothetical protein [Tenacibaculum sp. SG-28]|uniref:hypothetical protein n=1 Tax=Tenacibaculum sp. SG-28 TaxID=754426 RepID=UPI001304E3B5|nr:hypothetical protein [Tenacibaculum sp. SG-28]
MSSNVVLFSLILSFGINITLLAIRGSKYRHDEVNKEFGNSLGNKASFEQC